jgi:hypothetical protein
VRPGVSRRLDDVARWADPPRRRKRRKEAAARSGPFLGRQAVAGPSNIDQH